MQAALPNQTLQELSALLAANSKESNLSRALQSLEIMEKLSPAGDISGGCGKVYCQLSCLDG